MLGKIWGYVLVLSAIVILATIPISVCVRQNPWVHDIVVVTVLVASIPLTLMGWWMQRGFKKMEQERRDAESDKIALRRKRDRKIAA
jgi:hypothetical protein